MDLPRIAQTALDGPVEVENEVAVFGNPEVGLAAQVYNEPVARITLLNHSKEGCP